MFKKINHVFLIHSLIIGAFSFKLNAQNIAPDHSLYFVSGLTSIEKDSDAFQSFIERIDNAENSGTVVFLGDYLPDRALMKNSEGSVKKSWLEHIKSLPQDDDLNYVFLPGFKEWGKNNKNGVNLVRNANDDIREIIEKGELITAENACPGPYEIEINDDLILILINDYWLLHDNQVPKLEEGCPYARRIELLLELDQLLKRNENRKIVLAAINPLESAGPKGGHFKFKHHIFPLSVKNPGNRVPMPIFGSFYIWYRKFIGNPDDLSNLKSRVLNKYVSSLLEKYPNLVYVSANENHLDYREIGNSKQVISGSLNGGNYASKKGYKYNSTASGFAQLDYYTSGKLKLNFIENNQGSFEYTLLDLPPIVKGKPRDPIDYSDSTVSAFADRSIYKKGKSKPGLMGLNYRKEWAANLDSIPIFNWGKDLGGLEIVKKGGGMQTRSLRLENPKEKQYVLRSIKKYPENAVPAAIRGTVFADLVNDQISASHPYGAYAVPKLADAANIYHTNPKLVYLNHDPRLGNYIYDFEEGLYLYEERPAKDRSDIESFGRSEDIKSTFDVIDNLNESGKYFIDQEWVLKSRIFDMLIGDWDRHDDQWRWAEFDTQDDRKMYRPIPRDRDQAFFLSDGLILNLASRKWGQPKFQGFKDEIRDINGYNFNARYFDRSFLTQPEREDWLRMTRHIQNSLSDSIIEIAIKDLPPEIYKINGKNIERKLKRRRDDLDQYTLKFYEFLSKEVNVLGNDEENRFDIKRLENGDTEVIVYEVSKKKREIKYKIYERTFKQDETKEIRLYGLKGDDVFNLSGDANKGIKIRIIGGGGEDKIIDESKVKGLRKKTLVYDKKSGSTVEKSKETKDLRSNREDINDYDRYAFRYPKLLPFLSINYNPDDGVFIGGGPHYTNHGFRMDPFKQRHILLANIAPRSANYNLSYEGVFNNVISKWGVRINGLISTPSFSTFFYGLGNNSILSEDRREDDRQYYRVRFDTENIQTSLFRESNNNKHYFRFGVGYLRAHIDEELNRDDDDDDPRFILDLAADSGIHFRTFEEYKFAHSQFEYIFDSRNDKSNPENGVHFKFLARFHQDVKENKENSLGLFAEQSLYSTLSKRLKSILALRFGGSYMIGNNPFFLGPSLGGSQNLRGERRNRFWGDYSAYQNTELRVRLFTISNEFIISDFGFLFFHDIGRVWTKNTPINFNDIYSGNEINDFSVRDEWHQGYGFGMWIAPFKMAVLSADYSFNPREDNIVFVRLGFLY